MDELSEIGFKYGTDKVPQIKHAYTPFYFNLFNDKRQSIKKVLEMGIGCPRIMWHSRYYHLGASLYMWQDFFPNAQIFGADILPETIFSVDRIVTFLCDETKKEDLERLVKNTGSDIDIFIDDGSHKWQHQVELAKMILPMLKKDVVYIIEDVAFPDHIIKELEGYECSVPYLKGRKYRKSRIIIVKNK